MGRAPSRPQCCRCGGSIGGLAPPQYPRFTPALPSRSMPRSARCDQPSQLATGIGNWQPSHIGNTKPKNRSWLEQTFSHRGTEIGSFMDAHGSHLQYTFGVKPSLRFQRRQKPFSSILRTSVRHFIVLDIIRAVWYNILHEKQATITHQHTGAAGASAGEIPWKGLRLLQGRHDEIRSGEGVPHPGDDRRPLVPELRRKRRGRHSRRQARPKARRGKAQVVRRPDEGTEEGCRGQDAS